jgi:hypothetical protein
MKLTPTTLAIVVLAGIAFAGIAGFAAAPLLYSAETARYPSGFHANPEVLKRLSLNGTTDVLPLMQDVLDYTGPVVLNVRLK